MDARLPPNRRNRTPRASFRCLACARYTRATDAGVCPHCGWQPPTRVVAAARPDPRVWRRVTAHHTSLGSDLGRVLVALAIIAAVALAIARA